MIKEKIAQAMYRLSVEDEFHVLEEMPCCEDCALHSLSDQGVGPNDPYCFFHSGDDQQFSSNGEGYLSWGSNREDAELVVRRLQDVGLVASWDGEVGHRIHVSMP